MECWRSLLPVDGEGGGRKWDKTTISAMTDCCAIACMPPLAVEVAHGGTPIYQYSRLIGHFIYKDFFK